LTFLAKTWKSPSSFSLDSTRSTAILGVLYLDPVVASSVPSQSSDLEERKTLNALFQDWSAYLFVD
jgi:hypothetical protein